MQLTVDEVKLSATELSVVNSFFSNDELTEKMRLEKAIALMAMITIHDSGENVLTYIHTF